MKIPNDPVARYQFYQDTCEKVFSTVEERKPYYDVNRQYMRYGTATVLNGPVFNNMGAHLDLLASMLYAQDTTKFSMEPSATESADIFTQLPICGRRVQQEWADSNCDLVMGAALWDSFACGTSVVKLWWHRGLQVQMIPAEKFGVLRENIGMLDRQQAFGHKYEITRSALETMLEHHPRREKIMAEITPETKVDEKPQSGYDNVVIGSVTPTVIGNVAMPDDGFPEPVARVSEPQAGMTELVVWDDDLSDYQVVTLADPGVVIFDRPLADMFLKEESCYVQICPNPDPHYFWGRPEASKLRPLQDWLNERIDQVRRMLTRQAKPPIVGSGLMGDENEISTALTTPDNYVAADSISGFNVQELRPDIPEDLFREIVNIQEMFNQVSGLSQILQGRGEAGVRSDQHANTLGKFGSTRIKKRALVLEDALEKAATLVWKLLRKYSDDRLLDTDGKPFLMQQVPSGVSVKVDAHSSSPAFADDNKELALVLHKAGIIDAEAVLDIVHLPRTEALKQKAREMAEQRAKAAEKEQQSEKVIELAKIRKSA